MDNVLKISLRNRGQQLSPTPVAMFVQLIKVLVHLIPTAKKVFDILRLPRSSLNETSSNHPLMIPLQRTLLSVAESIYVGLRSNPQFIKAVVFAFESRGKDVIAVMTGYDKTITRGWQDFCEEYYRVKRRREFELPIYRDAPERFNDAITNMLMEDPVRLPKPL